jgi:hypothetical protein
MTRKMDFANSPCTTLMHEPTQAQFVAYQQMFANEKGKTNPGVGEKVYQIFAKRYDQ